MINTKGAAHRARWAVMWVGTKGKKRGRLIRHDFGDDYASAHELYMKAHDAGKPYATLACVNMGFPPPQKLRPYTARKRGRSKRTGRIKTVEVFVQPLKELNMQGKLWCPYCRQMRPFVLKKVHRVNGIPIHDPLYVCPMCKVSQRDYHVRLWNPTACLHMDSSLASTRRGPRRRSTPTKRRRR